MPFKDEDLTPIEPEGEKEQVADLSYFELVKLAQEKKIPGYTNLNKKQLLVALGAGPKGASVYDRTLGVSEAEMQQKRADREAIPGKTIYDPKYEEQLEKIWAMYPMAFNNFDMTDEKSPVVFHFERDIKCACGKEMIIARVYEATRDGEKVERVQTENIYERLCPSCGRKHIFLEPDREIPVDPALARRMGLIA